MRSLITALIFGLALAACKTTAPQSGVKNEPQAPLAAELTVDSSKDADEIWTEIDESKFTDMTASGKVLTLLGCVCTQSSDDAPWDLNAYYQLGELGYRMRLEPPQTLAECLVAKSASEDRCQ